MTNHQQSWLFPSGDGAATAAARPAAILDNDAEGTLLNAWTSRVQPRDALSLVSAYFTIHGFHALRRQLEGASAVRFLYGDPSTVGAVDATPDTPRAFRITEGGGLALSEQLAQKPLAMQCLAWANRPEVQFRKTTERLLHGKMSLAKVSEDAPPHFGTVGSSNLTKRGLGGDGAGNLELNLLLEDPASLQVLWAWFNRLWGKTEDAKGEVVAALSRLGARVSPDLLYHKILYEIFRPDLDALQAEQAQREEGFGRSAIWQALYDFQRDGAAAAHLKMMRYGGCILADEVGLGKTWTALAVIKRWQMTADNRDVLVLCPKRLENNWVRYREAAQRADNPFAVDRLNYTVLAHTDLTRTHGEACGIQLDNFNWRNFGLIVLDESHNFRTSSKPREDEEGGLKHTRYSALMEAIQGMGGHTKVLMLSATPVNTSFLNLGAQVALLTGGADDAYKGLDAPSAHKAFKSAKKVFEQWGGGKQALIDSLPSDFISILDASTVSRSRRHIEHYYPDDMRRFGGQGRFPVRAEPVNREPPLNRDDASSSSLYTDLRDGLLEAKLHAYTPQRHVAPDKADARWQRTETNLAAMVTKNMMKRLESSCYAFCMTATRIIAAMDRRLAQIEAWRAAGSPAHATVQDYLDGKGLDHGVDAADDDDALHEDEQQDASHLKLSDIDVDAWSAAIRKDRAWYVAVRDDIAKITPQQDGKLHQLRVDLTALMQAGGKALVFTESSDTAQYLYENLEKWAAGRGVGMGLVRGSGQPRTTVKLSASAPRSPDRTAQLLRAFAPLGQTNQALPDGEQGIDVLIATDCLSEGQNLQDCNLVINYDIHWNPVRLIQREGRINRLGSPHPSIRTIHFWPPGGLDAYLELRAVVEKRIEAINVGGPGTGTEIISGTKSHLDPNSFRDRQMRALRNCHTDWDADEDAVTMDDLSLQVFLSDLRAYMEANKKALEACPTGACTVADAPHRAGLLFCLRADGPEAPYSLNGHYLAHVDWQGKVTVRSVGQHPRRVLDALREMAIGREVDVPLADVFDALTDSEAGMAQCGELLTAAVDTLKGTVMRASPQELLENKITNDQSWSEDFTLVGWVAASPPVQQGESHGR